MEVKYHNPGEPITIEKWDRFVEEESRGILGVGRLYDKNAHTYCTIGAMLALDGVPEETLANSASTGIKHVYKHENRKQFIREMYARMFPEGTAKTLVHQCNAIVNANDCRCYQLNGKELTWHAAVRRVFRLGRKKK